MTKQKSINVQKYNIANNQPFTLIAGPCALESYDHAAMMSEALQKICTKLGINLIYKTSFDKANRTAVDADRGLGLSESLKIFTRLKQATGLPILTDVHTAEQCGEVGAVVDVLQIPAFLCRQTDLLLAAGQTGKPINVKKGQFLAPWDMKNVAQKIASTGNEQVMLCERGVSFGYNTLVNDMRALPIMVETGYPVIFDATHSVQQPGAGGTKSGGDRRFVPFLMRAALSIGVAGVFMEVHQDPDNAPSDGPNMVRLDNVEHVLTIAKQFDNLAKANMEYLQ